MTRLLRLLVFGAPRRAPRITNELTLFILEYPAKENA